MRLCLLVTFGWLLAVSCASAQVPPRWEDLPKLAATWPPAWAALVRESNPPRDLVKTATGEDHLIPPTRIPFRLKDPTFTVEVGAEPIRITGDQITEFRLFEHQVVDRVAARLRDKPALEDYQLADIVLMAMFRRHASLRYGGSPADDAWWDRIHAELLVRQRNIRQVWMSLLNQYKDTKVYQELAERWSRDPTTRPLYREYLVGAWLGQSSDALKKKDYAAMNDWLRRIDDVLGHDGGIELFEKDLHDRARSLLKESQDMPDPAAIPLLEQALAMWPRLPEARDALLRRKGAFQTLTVAVRALPDRLSPASAATEIERQTLELLFDRLYQLDHSPGVGKRYRPQLATVLPVGKLAQALPLRRDVYWASGERVTSADLRHTALLMNQADAMGRSALWRDYLDIPRVEGNAFDVSIQFRRGLFDPQAALGFWILPQSYKGKQLQRADDADFAQAPLGSGPFEYLGRKADAGQTFAVFRANPHDLRQGPIAVREIRFVTWSDPRKDLAKPLPQLILDAPTDQLAALKGMGYAEVEPKSAGPVSFLAINHRKPALASASLRRAIALGLDRQGLLDRHFRATAGQRHASANGLYPRVSWANAPAPRVLAEMFHVEQARSLARKAKAELAMVMLTVKYPTGEKRVQAACEEMAATIATLLQEVGIKADVQTQGLPPHALQKALHERDFDLLYTSADGLDDPVRLALLFDRQEDATRAGGSNFLGYDNDAKLHDLLQAALQHRQFTAVQDSMQAIHQHLFETMPAIPLWHLDTHVLAQPSLRAPTLDPHAVFANVRSWKVVP